MSSVSKVKVVAENREKFKTVVKVGSFELVFDVPQSLGGDNQGPSPTTGLLASLAACVAAVTRLHSNRLGIPVNEVKIEVEGTIDSRGLVDDEIPAGFQDITVKVIINSPADLNKLKDLIAIVEKHCPVGYNIKYETPLKVDVVKAG